MDLKQNFEIHFHEDAMTTNISVRLWRESTSDRWIPPRKRLVKSSFDSFCCQCEKAVRQKVVLLVI